jgi:two-component system chemotaxis response regulator CheY
MSIAIPKNSHFLIVDDSVHMRNIIADSLKQLGFGDITMAESVKEAESKMASMERPVDIILCDINMPGETGIDFLKKIRTNEKYKDLPFLLITTDTQKGSVVNALMSGVSNYIVKPFNLEGLTQRLDAGWKKHHT